MDHQVPAWLEATVNAAGLAAVYNAEDWSQADKPQASDSLPELPH